jgi:hypothetical protein
MMFLLLPTVLPLAREFISLIGPTEVFDVAAAAVFLPTDPKESDLKGEESPETQRKCIRFQSSDPSPGRYLQRPELGRVGVVENLRCRR